MEEPGDGINIGGAGEKSRGVGVVEAREVELGGRGLLLDVGLVGGLGLRIAEFGSLIKGAVGGWRGV